MTTVTEAVKYTTTEDLEEAIASGDLKRICRDGAAAKRFLEHLLQTAHELAPRRDWKPEDLKAILDSAMGASPRNAARLMEGRYFRKRLREQLNLADRYGDSFAVVVISVADGVHETDYTSILDAVTERLRQTDMLFLYRRRFALVLPRLRMASLEPLIERVRELISVGAGDGAVRQISAAVYPDARFEESSQMLDWAEDQLR